MTKISYGITWIMKKRYNQKPHGYKVHPGPPGIHGGPRPLGFWVWLSSSSVSQCLFGKLKGQTETLGCWMDPIFFLLLTLLAISPPNTPKRMWSFKAMHDYTALYITLEKMWFCVYFRIMPDYQLDLSMSEKSDAGWRDKGRATM